MDASKFVRAFRRICIKHNRCASCLLNKTLLCDSKRELSQEESEKIVEIVENWSKENPEEVGKKYIIEIDEVDSDACRIKDAKWWIYRENLEKLKEYKGE